MADVTTEIDRLRASEARLRLLIEATGTGTVILDGEGRVIDANSEYLRLCGHHRLEEIVGRSVSDWTAEHDRARHAVEVRACVERGAVRNIEIDFEGPDGRLVPVEINASTVHADGDITIVAVCRDISTRRQAGALQAQTEQRYRLFAAHSEEIIFRLRLPDGQYEYMSPAVTLLSGYTPEECYATPFLVQKLLPPDWQAEFVAGIAEMCRGNVPPFLEYPIITRSGETRWALQRNYLVWDEAHSHPVALEGIVIDITERRRADEVLRSSELRYRATIDSMSEMIHMVDSDLKILLVNATGERWLSQLGLTANIVGHSLFEAFSFLPDGVRAEYRQVFDSATTLVTEEHTTIAGREIVTETRKIPIVEAGRVAHVVTVLRDITDMVHAQERLRRAEKMEAVGQLAGGIAHDFNNQLAAILGFAELLSRRVADPGAREYAATIARTASRAAELTRQLLAFARKGRGRSEPVDVHAVVRDVTALIERIVDKRIVVASRLTAERTVVNGDAGQLQSALLNLAINARDAMPDGGVLTLATDVVESGVPCLRVRVTDTGTGMSEETRRHLFEPFFTTKEPGKGTGMGLATVYGTVAGHKGTVEVVSELGHGSTFAVLLPLAHATPEAAEAPPGEVTVPGRGHILLAEDEPAVRAMVQEALRGLGYQVTACADGIEAVARFSAMSCDLVLLDVSLPRLGGCQAFAAMRAVDPTVRGILCSGQAINEEMQSLIGDGAVDFLAKPFHLAELASKVAAMLRR